MPEKNKFSCNKHLDIAFDDFLTENETFPCLEKTEEHTHTCSYCTEEASYMLKLDSSPVLTNIELI